MSIMRVQFTVGALAILACARAGAATVIADSEGMAFENPHASEGGQVVTMDRVLHRPEACGQVFNRTTDVYLYRHDANCGRKVLQRFTHDGISGDACPSADGTRIAWRTFDGTENHVFVGDVDGVNPPTEVFACPGFMSDLELSPISGFVVFKVFGRTSPPQAEIIRIDVAAPGVPDVVDLAPNADDLGLSFRRCIDAGGFVYYSKNAGGPHDLWKDPPGISPPQRALPASAEDERSFTVSATSTGQFQFCVFKRRSLTGIDNLFWLGVAGETGPITSNTNSAWTIGSAILGTTSDLVGFTSNGDFTGGNADGSFELFSIGSTGQQPRQVTDMDPVWPQVLGFGGFDIKDDVTNDLLDDQTAWWAHTLIDVACACCTEALNELRVSIASQRATSEAPVFDPLTVPDTIPSFEGESASCNLVPMSPSDILECTLVVRNSGEGARRVLIFAQTRNVDCPGPSILYWSPVEITLPSASTVTIKIDYRPGGCDGPAPRLATFDLVSPDGSQADVQRIVAEY